MNASLKKATVESLKLGSRIALSGGIAALIVWIQGLMGGTTDPMFIIFYQSILLILDKLKYQFSKEEINKTLELKSPSGIFPL